MTTGRRLSARFEICWELDAWVAQGDPIAGANDRPKHTPFAVERPEETLRLLGSLLVTGCVHCPASEGFLGACPRGA